MQACGGSGGRGADSPQPGDWAHRYAEGTGALVWSGGPWHKDHRRQTWGSLHANRKRGANMDRRAWEYGIHVERSMENDHQDR